MRNSRGRSGLPAEGRAETEPTSIEPNPSAASASVAIPFLSKPAGRPTGLGKSMPAICVRRLGCS
jgi:hypothetical protein